MVKDSQGTRRQATQMCDSWGLYDTRAGHLDHYGSRNRYSDAISSLIFAIAVPGSRPFGQVREPNNKYEIGNGRGERRKPTVEDGMAPVQAHRVLQSLLTLCTVGVL